MKKKIVKTRKKTKTEVGGDGTPYEILRKALKLMKGKYPPVNAMIVAWYSQNERGSGTMTYLFTANGGERLTALLSDLTFENHISRRDIYGKNHVADEVYPNRP